MATLRETVVSPLGLITYPNTRGQYPAGAMLQAGNVVMRAPGEVWPAPGFGTQTFGFFNDDILQKLFPVDGGFIFSWNRRNSTGAWIVGVGTPSFAVGACAFPQGLPTPNFSQFGQIWPVRARERMFVSTLANGLLVCDSVVPSTPALRALRSAGMPQPHIYSFLGATGGSIPTGLIVGYGAVIRRQFTDGYFVTSVPSPTVRFLNITGSTSTPSVLIYIGPPAFIGATENNAGVAVGDFIDIYRTDGLVATTALTDPGDTLKLIQRVVITSADILAGNKTVTDTTAMIAPFYQTSGPELYTNPGQETALQANRQPNTSSAMAVYKNYTFYGDITERPRWTFQVPAGIGLNSGSVPNPAPSTAYWRTNGIGARVGTGTVTSGSPTITAISGTDILGLKVGQVWAGSNLLFASTAAITVVGGTSVTLSLNAVGGTGVPGSIAFADVIVLDGVQLPSIINIEGYLYARGYEVTIDSSIPVSDGFNANNGYFTGATISIEPLRPYQTSMTVKATNGANYQEAVPEFTATAKTFAATRRQNYIQWSKNAQPELVGPANELRIGTGTIITMAPTKNALWIFCTDGLYRLSGELPPWNVQWFDPNLIVCGPQAVTVLKDTVYAYANYGVTAITDEGANSFTANSIADIFPGPTFSIGRNPILERNETDDEVVVSLGDGILYIYNTRTNAWTRLFFEQAAQINNITALAFQRAPISGPQVLLVGSSPGLGASTPTYASWNAPGVTYLNAYVTYQPWFGDDLMSMKQFVDVTHVFDTPDSGKVITTDFGVGAAASGPLVVHLPDALVTLGVPRSVAIGHAIYIDFNIPAASTQAKYRGTSIRLVTMTDQSWRK